VVGPGALMGTWLVDFIYCGACFGLVALVAESPRLATLARHILVIPASAIVVLLVVTGVVSGFVVRAYQPGTLQGLLGLPGLAAAAGVALTFIGYRHQPAALSHGSAGGPALTAPPEALPRYAYGRRQGLHLLVWEHTLWAALAVTALFAFVLILSAGHPLAETMAQVVGTFEKGIVFHYAGGAIPWISGDWFALLIFGGRNAVAPMLRHLRVLPLSTAALNATMLLLALPYWLIVTFLFAGIHYAVTGALPRFDMASLVLAAGITIMAQSWHVAAAGTSAGFFSGGMTISVSLLAGFAARAMLPPPWQLLTQHTGLGILLIAGAAVLNHRVLTRRSPAPRRTPALA
jgi:hypothetical protein